MIYASSKPDDAIRQGDIFLGVPRVSISLGDVPVVGPSNAAEVVTWAEICRVGEPVTALLAVKPVTAIVASQDCDAVRAPDVTLCEIRKFQDVERLSAQTTAPKKWVSIITQQARLNYKWFYLPPDPLVGFSDKMGADFQTVFTLPRLELEALRHLRKARLKEIAEAHFRERIAEFFRRYPYDEWYSLNPEEFQVYEKDHEGAAPFPWQIAPTIET